MKKILVPVAMAVGFVASAQAQFTIYGLIDASYGKSLLADVFLQEKADFHSGGDNGSSEGNSTTRLGIRGATDVGSGIKAKFNLETGGITSRGEVNPGGPFFNRQAWLGFEGSFGEIRLGRQDSVAFQLASGYDFNGASNGVSALGYSAVAPWLPGRQSRSLQYISPSAGGVTLQLGFVPKGNEGPGAKAVASAGVKFDSGPFSAAVNFQSKDSNTTKQFASVAGSFDFGAAKVMASFADGGKFNDGGSGRGVGLGFVAPVGSVNVGALVGRNTDSNLKLQSYELFANTEIFKGTYLYGEMGKWKTSLASNPLDATAKRSGTGYALGVIYTF